MRICAPKEFVSSGKTNERRNLNRLFEGIEYLVINPSMRVLLALIAIQILTEASGTSGFAQEEKSFETLSGRTLSRSSLARISYRQLIKIARSDSISEVDSDSYRLRIQSRNSLVSSHDIKLYLDVEGAPVILVVDNDGFVEVPFSKKMLELNPDLIANQPKGTLNIFVDLEIPKVEPPKIKDGKVDYRELFRPLLAIQKEMRKVNPIFGLAGQQQFVLEVDTEGIPLKITRELGSPTFSPTKDGKIYMILESYLFEENPIITIPDEAKIQILTKSPEEIEEIRSN